MFRFLTAAWVLAVGVLPVLSALAAEPVGYEAVNLAARETVDGKLLVIAAYTVIFVFLALYAASIVRREQKVLKSIEVLKKNILSKK